MIHLKGNFLKALMISLVCISFSCAITVDNLDWCIDAIYDVFNRELTVPLERIKYGILNLKIYGENRQLFFAHVIKYYELFHLLVNTDNIQLPAEFCGEDDDCIDELNIFTKYIPALNLLQSDRDMLNNIFARSNRNFEEEPETDIILKSNILKNALYFHKIIRENDPIIQQLTDESWKYFHPNGTLGFNYLNHIANVVHQNNHSNNTIQCVNNMLHAFGDSQRNLDSIADPLQCIKKAVTKMNIYSINTYNEDVIDYYKEFHVHVNPEFIQSRRQFCSINTCDVLINDIKDIAEREKREKDCRVNFEKCRDELKIFEDEILPDEDLALIGGLSNVINPYWNIGSSSHETPAEILCSSSHETPAETLSLKYNTLINALYYHKQGSPRAGTVTIEKKKYFHIFPAFGYKYLYHIARVIQLKDEMQTPTEFCLERHS